LSINIVIGTIKMEELGEIAMQILMEQHDAPECCGTKMQEESDGKWHCKSCGKTKKKSGEESGGKGGDDGNGNVVL
jgi:ribosomal protein L37AE/L43A